MERPTDEVPGAGSLASAASHLLLKGTAVRIRSLTALRGVAPVDLRRAFHDLPQPVAVVTGVSPSGQPVGMTVGSLTSVSLAPPLVLFCAAAGSRAWRAAREHGTFAVNILGQQHGELALRFSRPGDRFAGVRTVPTDDDVPVLADALAVLVCDIHDEHPAGDHTVVVGRVRAVRVLRAGTGLDTVSLRALAGAARLAPGGPRVIPGRGTEAAGPAARPAW